MSTNPVLVPISLVSQFLANEKMASRHWFQCQMECLLDQVFDQLSTKFEDYLASYAITGTAHHTTIDSDHIQHQHRHEPSVQAHSHTRLRAPADHLIKTEFSVDVEQSPNQVQMINIDEQLNPNGIHSEAVMFDQAHYSHSSSVPISNLEQSTNQNDDEYGFDENDYQTQNEDIDDAAARTVSDEIDVKEEIDDSQEELFTIDQAQCRHSSSVQTSNIEQLNQNDDKDETNGQLPNEDDDSSRFDIGEVKVKEEIDDSNNELITSDRNSQIDLPVSASASNEQSNPNWTSENDEEYDFDGTRNDEQSNGLEYGDIDDDARMDSDEVEVKEEIDDTNNELSTTKLQPNSSLLAASISNVDKSNGNDYEKEYILDYQPLNEQLDLAMLNKLIANYQNSPILPSVVILTSNEQSNQNDDYGLDGEYGQQQNENLREENDDNERNEHTEELSRPRKRRRIDKTQPNIRHTRVTRQSLRREQSNIIERQPSEETDDTNEVDTQDKLIITLSMHCLETDCPLMFTNKTELNAHVSTQHGILLFRCLVKDCKQSFSTQNNMSGHIKQIHSNTSQWHCDKCPKHFVAYQQLSDHNYQYHQLGQYSCAFANCTFTGGHRRKVFDHYRHQHKTTIVEFICQHPGCGRRFNKTSSFKRHQRTHLGIKPYRCKWSGCNYASTTQSNALRHIKEVHLTPDQSSNEDDPKKYLEVLRDLL